MVASSVRHPIKIGDKTYNVSPITDEGREALDEWVRAKFVERVTPIIDGMTEPADKALALDRAYAQAFRLTFMSPEGAAMMGTIEGVAKLLYEGLRPNHPEVTYEELLKHLYDPNTIQMATRVFRELNIRRVEEVKPTAGKKRTRSPRKKST